MTALILIDFGADDVVLSALHDLSDVPDAVALPDTAPGVSGLRDHICHRLAPFGGVVLAFGAGGTAPVIAADRAPATERLRQAFGSMTGAALRLRDAGGGPILVVLPSHALIGADEPFAQAILLRAVIGMAEALRAELGTASTVRVSIVFYDPGDDDRRTLARRLDGVLVDGPMYSLSADLTPGRIRAYFDPMLRALDETSAGAPLPDIGPMAAVYDPAAIGLPLRDA